MRDRGKTDSARSCACRHLDRPPCENCSPATHARTVSSSPRAGVATRSSSAATTAVAQLVSSDPGSALSIDSPVHHPTPAYNSATAPPLPENPTPNMLLTPRDVLQ